MFYVILGYLCFFFLLYTLLLLKCKDQRDSVKALTAPLFPFFPSIFSMVNKLDLI